jgi:hypothetical protein
MEAIPMYIVVMLALLLMLISLMVYFFVKKGISSEDSDNEYVEVEVEETDFLPNETKLMRRERRARRARRARRGGLQNEKELMRRLRTGGLEGRDCWGICRMCRTRGYNDCNKICRNCKKQDS